MPAPLREPTLTSIPFDILWEATMLEITSGAPFPKAKNVTPARFWLIFSLSDTAVRAQDKYLFAVLPVR